MLKKLSISLILSLITLLNISLVQGATSSTTYTTLWVVDIWTFNEYKYRMTEQYLELRSTFEVSWKINRNISARILNYAEQWYNYLPDDLINRNYLNSLKSAIERWLQYPENSSYFQSIASALEDYMTKVSITSVRWSVEAFPSSWNAPLTASLRWNVVDPSWTKLENYNYTWWMNVAGKRVILGNRVNLSYVFKEEWNYSVFLDVTSNHKNSRWNVDVLPFSSRVDIEVREKIASIILKVNSITLGNQEELKFTPDEARYWLLFDATSSTPTSWARFTRTEWDFGNWVKRVYEGSPQIERVVFASEWDYTVSLKLRTNEWKEVERKFVIRVHQPIATITASAEEWYMWDKFTFTAKNNSSQSNITYSWRIIDINNDAEIVWRNSSTFTYTFTNKGRYNVQLFVTEPSWDVDYDSKIIYINSRPPEARLKYTTPFSNKPNTIFLDASSSYDSDYTDDWKLTFRWTINWEEVQLNSPNANGSNWYYTFNSLWEHSVSLEVTDPDNMSSVVTQKVTIRSLLSVDFNIFPRVSQIDKTVRFVADSPDAEYFEWNFWDQTIKWETQESITHVYDKSWTYQVRLKVVDSNDNENTFTKNVFIWESDYPYPFINVLDNTQNEIIYSNNECNWEGAYIVNRVGTYNFNWSESIDVNGLTQWLSYSWRLWTQVFSSQTFQKRFEELGCQKLRLSVTSGKNGRSASKDVNVKVVNLAPTLWGLDLSVQNLDSDPVIVNVTAQGAKDLDWVIQSYLWYYYTDSDSEPQDIRSTRNNSTSFVIPKIRWNYYFVVVMRDDNETLVNSEEISDSRYFLTLTWDNANIPLVGLKVNNSSVSIWDEVTFTANVENIMGQSLNNLASYSWDFDWDWFYDMETTTNIVTHRYSNSWEKYAKVRVKYRWYSNTKNITISVANVLRANFEYLSVWSNFVFFDNSLSNNASYEWNMWDWNIIRDKKSFIYKYEGSEPAYNVRLRLTEWTKISEKTLRVVKNIPNLLKSNREELAVFSNYELNEDKIILDSYEKPLYLYLTSNREDVAYYVADFNINYDSNLNWWNDDDEDNLSQESYRGLAPILISIDNSKTQIVRVTLKDSAWQILESKDISIEKTYIEEDVNIDSIVFDWVPDSVKQRLEKIKQAVMSFPQAQRLEWMIYIQRLQEEWNDPREKTNIIIDFETFIINSWVSNASELVDILESLLIDWDTEGSEKTIAYTALKNLIPTNIACIWDSATKLAEQGWNCYDLLVERLDLINENYNIDENKIIWLSILENIAEDTTMTVQEKLDFKAILNTFVYGSVTNIPTEEQEEVVQEWWDGNSTFTSIFFGIIKFLWVVILVIGWVIWIFFVYYKISNKDSNIWFTDFISERTWAKSSSKNSTEIIKEDMFADDILESTPSINKTVEKSNIQVEDTSSKEIKEVNINKEDWEIPSWLKSSFDWDVSEDSKIDSKWKVPDWLSQTFDETSKIEKQEDSVELEEEKETPKQEEEEPVMLEDKAITQEKELSSEIKDEEKNIEEWPIPDWLKWALPVEGNKEEQELEVNINETQEPKLETKEELDDFTKIDKTEEEESKEEEDNLPDWLKQDAKKEKIEELKETKEKKEEKVEDNKKVSTPKKKKTSKEQGTKKTDKEKDKKIDIKESDEEDKKQVFEKELDAPDTELWDDGMKVPDWLKTDDEK